MIWPLFLFEENVTIMFIFIMIAVFKFSINLKKVLLLFAVLSNIIFFALSFYYQIKVQDGSALILFKALATTMAH